MRRAGAWLPRLVPYIRFAGLLLGLLTFALVAFGDYDRAAALSGRTEVVTVRSDGSAFSAWQFAQAEFLPDPDTPVRRGPVAITLRAGADARFVRLGRGAMSVSFAAGPGMAAGEAGQPGCAAGALSVGSIREGEEPERPLCDDTRVRIAAMPGSGPTVVSLRGGIEVGEEVRAGAGAQPVLLNASARLFVRHGAPFDRICELHGLESLCDRFVASEDDLAVGDSVSLRGEGVDAPAAGFLRLDPDEPESGMRFDVSAPNAGLEVRRLEGETYHLSESLFDRIQKSRVIQALNASILALGLVWWFVRAPGQARSGADGSLPGCVLLCAGLVAATVNPARADQAFLRSGEIGQALLRSRADRCYGVTLEHVMAGETAASVVAPGRSVGDADLLRLVPAAPETLALLSVRGIQPDLCPAFEGARALDGVLRANEVASLRLVNSDGSLSRIPLTVQFVDTDAFAVVPAEAAVGFRQGMSGGTVFIGQQPVGLLVDVTEGRTGRVVRLDRVFEHLAPYLGGDLVAPAVPTPARPGSAAAAGEIGLTVVRWSEEPVAPANRAGALLEPAGTWRVGAARADLVAQVAGGNTVAAIAVDGGGQPDPARTVEVLFGATDAGPWRSVASFALEPGDAIRRVGLAPTRTGYVLLRLTGRQQGSPAMSLSGFHLYTR